MNPAVGGLVVALGLLTLVWVGSVVRRDASLVDRFWGAGFVVLAVYYWTTAEAASVQSGTASAVVLGLVALWGVRLSGYLTWRNWGHGEDYRYQAMRQKTGPKFWWTNLLTVHYLQAVIMWFVSLPLLAGLQGQASIRHPLVWLGFVLFAVGFYFEAAGDWQLTRFRANEANRGRVLDSGVWRYTRHPNYFGDACLWWGFYGIAVAADGGWTVLSPLVMTGLLLKVSGVALLEKKLVETKPQYRDYVARTSSFLPMPPRRSATMSGAPPTDRGSAAPRA